MPIPAQLHSKCDPHTPHMHRPSYQSHGFPPASAKATMSGRSWQLSFKFCTRHTTLPPRTPSLHHLPLPGPYYPPPTPLSPPNLIHFTLVKIPSNSPVYSPLCPSPSHPRPPSVRLVISSGQLLPRHQPAVHHQRPTPYSPLPTTQPHKRPVAHTGAQWLLTPHPTQAHAQQPTPYWHTPHASTHHQLPSQSSSDT